MIKSYAKYDEAKNRTTPISVNGTTRWITADMALDIEDWKQAAIAAYAARLGNGVTSHQRIYVIYQSPQRDYVMSVTDPAWDSPLLYVVASPLSISDVTKRYDADARWQRVVAGINPVTYLIA